RSLGPGRRRSRDGLQGRERRPSRFSELQAAQPPRAGGAEGALHRSLRDGSGARTGRDRARGRRRALSRDAAPRIPGSADPPGQSPVRRVELDPGRGALKILVTGSAGFIAGYLVQELLARGHEVVGVDNYSKYGRVEKSYQRHPGYTFLEG